MTFAYLDSITIAAHHAFDLDLPLEAPAPVAAQAGFFERRAHVVEGTQGRIHESP